MSQSTNIPTSAHAILITPTPPAVASSFQWRLSDLKIPQGVGLELTLRGCWPEEQLNSATAEGYVLSRDANIGRPSLITGLVTYASGVVKIAFAPIETTLTQIDLTIIITVNFSEPLASVAAGTLLDVMIRGTGFRLPVVFGTGGPVGKPPADPTDLAPSLDRSVATDLGRLTSFLYTGSNPIQCGVVPGALAAQRITLLRGKIVAEDSAGTLQPLSGVAVSVREHVGYGVTVSRADGTFDLVVNGGQRLDLVFEKPGYLPVHRHMYPRWRESRQVPDVVMIAQNAAGGQLLDTSAIQSARGAEVEDAHGKRQATLIVPANTEATMVLANGTPKSLTSFHVRALEYTVGPNGPQMMPADLPPTSGYTYCVEYTMDEAEAAGAQDVQFSQPIFHYVENFLGFPVGSVVPMGSYDKHAATWVPSENGRVIQIIGVTNDGTVSRAELDVDGGVANLPPLGISDDEREQLAMLYPIEPGQPGKKLWRVPIQHFSPWDCNWPYGPPADGTTPGQPKPDQPGPDNNCDGPGSIIGYQNQKLGEAIAITGISLGLHYHSDRVPGRLDNTSLDISLSGSDVPASLTRIDLEVHGAGQFFAKSFENQPNQRYTFTWDGNDGYGRRVQGRQHFMIRLGYAYGAVYMEPGQVQQAFANYGSAITGTKSRQEVVLWQEWSVWLGTWDHLAQGLGGWSLSAHHSYDVGAQVLYLGDGRRRTIGGLNLDVISTIAGGGKLPLSAGESASATKAQLDMIWGLTIDAQGILYIAHEWGIRRVVPNGTIQLYAGGGNPPDNVGDGGSAMKAAFQFINDLVIGPDNSLYVADVGKKLVRKINPSGIITTIAGSTGGASSADGGLATQTAIDPRRLAVASDGTLYILELTRLRRVSTNGIITTIAADKSVGSTGDGGFAANASLHDPQDIALGKDGSIYIAEGAGNRVRRIGPDGMISTIAGTGAFASSGDGDIATNAQLQFPKHLAIASDDSIYITENGSGRLRRIRSDGIIETFAGTGVLAQGDAVGDNGPPRQAQLGQPLGLVIGPDGSVYFADLHGPRVRRIGSMLAWLHVGDTIIPAEGGDELYVFNNIGQHSFTLDSLSGKMRLTFGYDDAGRLATITDADNRQLTLTHAPDGSQTTLTAPGGQQTMLTLDGNGYLAGVTNPAGEIIELTYKEASGLLTTLRDPNHNLSSFSYDELGRLQTDQDPVQGVQTLSRAATGVGYIVTAKTAEQRTTTYLVESQAGGRERQVITYADGRQATDTTALDSTQTITYADGTVVAQQRSPDPRWGMLTPLLTAQTLVLPSKLTRTLSAQRLVQPAALAKPFDFETLTDNIKINTQTFTNEYTAATRTAILTTPTGRSLLRVWNANGRIEKIETDGVTPTAYTYEAGHLKFFAQGIRTVTYDYDQQQRLHAITSSFKSVTTLTYYPSDRVKQITLPNATTIAFAYDANGNLSSLTPPGRPAHTLVYTAVNLLQDYIPPVAPDTGTNTTHYDYNLDRQLLKITRPDGDTIDYTYDSTTGRLKTVTTSYGTVTYDHDPATGMPATMTTPGGSILSLTYDGPLLTSETWVGPVSGSVQRTYDNHLRVSAFSLNGGTSIAYVHDDDGLLKQVGDLLLQRDLDAKNGQLSGSSLGVITDRWHYNEFAEPQSYSVSVGGAPLYSVTYERDQIGRIHTLSETIGGVTTTSVFDYAADLNDLAHSDGYLHRVTRDGSVATYQYDGNGNRKNYTGAGGPLGGTYDDQDRLTMYGSATYTYTASGELQSKTSGDQTTTYSYDALGNLRAVTLPDGTSIEYLIDGRNRRVGKRVNGALTQGFLYQGKLRPVAELDAQGQVVSRFIYATRTNVPDYMVKGGVAYRIIADHLGSPRLVLNTATGEVVQRIDYDAFGIVLADSNPGFQPFGFAGGLYDRHIKLTRFGARDYDAETGHWTAKDPIMFAGGDPNLYRYVWNDPVNSIDPVGMGVWKDIVDVARMVKDAVGIAMEVSNNLGGAGPPGQLNPKEKWKEQTEQLQEAVPKQGGASGGAGGTEGKDRSGGSEGSGDVASENNSGQSLMDTLFDVGVGLAIAGVVVGGAAALAAAGATVCGGLEAASEGLGAASEGLGAASEGLGAGALAF